MVVKCPQRIFAVELYFLASLQDEIIPENFRAKVEAEEKEKELADSYLPPRVRKTLQQINQGDNDGNVFIELNIFCF